MRVVGNFPLVFFFFISFAEGFNVKLANKTDVHHENSQDLLAELEAKLIELSSRSQSKVKTLNISEADDNLSSNTTETDDNSLFALNDEDLLKVVQNGTLNHENADNVQKKQFFNQYCQPSYFSAASGVITGPRVRGVCDFHIRSSTNSRIELTFTSLNVPCGWDGIITTINPAQVICGTSSTVPLVQTSGDMQIRLVSNSGYSYFTASYRIISNTPPTTPAPIPQAPVNDHVDLDRDQGVLESRNYPGNYPHNLKQVWNIHGSVGKVIRLNFESFDVRDMEEDGDDCYVYDSLIIDDGTTIDSTRVYPNCKPIPNTLVLASNAAEITFSTDRSLTATGFRITYDMVDPDSLPVEEEGNIGTPAPSNGNQLPTGNGNSNNGINSPTCGRLGPGSRARRVMGGQLADAHEYPWMVHMRAFVSSRSYQQCGAALLSDRWVLTAAHCLEKRRNSYVTASAVELYFGEHSLRQREYPQQRMDAQNLFIHPYRDDDAPGAPYDIALIKTERPVSLNDHVNTICLDDTGVTRSGTSCLVAGWGKEHKDGRTVDVLKEVELDVLTNYECGRQWQQRIPNDMICASKHQSLASSCQGDSGGPLACASGGKYYLSGVVSWGNPCGEAGGYNAPPSVFSRVSHYSTWIKEVIATNP